MYMYVIVIASWRLLTVLSGFRRLLQLACFKRVHVRYEALISMALCELLRSIAASKTDENNIDPGILGTNIQGFIYIIGDIGHL